MSIGTQILSIDLVSYSSCMLVSPPSIMRLGRDKPKQIIKNLIRVWAEMQNIKSEFDSVPVLSNYMSSLQ